MNGIVIGLESHKFSDPFPFHLNTQNGRSDITRLNYVVSIIFTQEKRKKRKIVDNNNILLVN